MLEQEIPKTRGSKVKKWNIYLLPQDYKDFKTRAENHGMKRSKYVLEGMMLQEKHCISIKHIKEKGQKKPYPLRVNDMEKQRIERNAEKQGISPQKYLRECIRVMDAEVIKTKGGIDHE